MDQQIDLVYVESLLTSDSGKLIAAGVLALLVWLLKNVPWVAAHITTPWQKRLFALGLAFIPTLVMALSKAPDIKSAFFTTFFAFLGSTAFHHLFLDGPDAPVSPDNPGKPIVVSSPSITIEPTTDPRSIPAITEPAGEPTPGPADPPAAA
jgi:hypothetical protein